MLKVNVEEDCGNAPKRELLRDFTIAFGSNNPAFILDNIADDIYWDRVGSEPVDGKPALEEMLKEMLGDSMQELTIANVLTHGAGGAVNGTMIFADGSVYGFCDVYTFTGHSKTAKIKRITSYIIEIAGATQES